MNAAGKQEAMYEAITAGEKDYSALVSKLKQANVDVVYLGGYHTEAGLIVRQMRDQGMNTILMGGDALITQEFWSITGAAGEGTLMTFSPDPRKNPAAAEVVKRFKDKGIEPEGYVLYTYAALQAWKQAAEKAKIVEIGRGRQGAERHRVRHGDRQVQVQREGRPEPAALRRLSLVEGHLRADQRSGLPRRQAPASPSSPRASSAANWASSSFSNRDQVVGQRHAEGAHLVQLLADLQIELVRILGLVLHLIDEESKFRLQIVKCHGRRSLATGRAGSDHKRPGGKPRRARPRAFVPARPHCRAANSPA